MSRVRIEESDIRRPNDSFEFGTCFETVWRRYRFDRRLRLAVMDRYGRPCVPVSR